MGRGSRERIDRLPILSSLSFDESEQQQENDENDIASSSLFFSQPSIHSLSPAIKQIEKKKKRY